MIRSIIEQAPAILNYGIIGLGFLLAVLLFILIYHQLKRGGGSIRSILLLVLFMLFCLAVVGAVLIVELKPNGGPDEPDPSTPHSVDFRIVSFEGGNANGNRNMEIRLPGKNTSNEAIIKWDVPDQAGYHNAPNDKHRRIQLAPNSKILTVILDYSIKKNASYSNTVNTELVYRFNQATSEWEPTGWSSPFKLSGNETVNFEITVIQ